MSYKPDFNMQWACECGTSGMSYLEFARHIRGCVTNYECPIIVECWED